jgi:hypothetical protein
MQCRGSGWSTLGSLADKESSRKKDLWLLYEGGRLSRQEQDTNGDGKADLWIEVDAQGRPRSRATTRSEGVTPTR